LKLDREQLRREQVEDSAAEKQEHEAKTADRSAKLQDKRSVKVDTWYEQHLAMHGDKRYNKVLKCFRDGVGNVNRRYMGNDYNMKEKLAALDKRGLLHTGHRKFSD